MQRDFSRGRLRVLTVCFSVLFVVFALRLVQIQGIDSQAYAAKAIDAGARKTVIPAPRGDILDRNGEAMVSSTAGTSLTADPYLTGPNAPKIAKILTEELGDRIDYFDTVELLRKPESRFVYVTKNVPAYSAKKALSALSEASLPGVFGEGVSLRKYPGGSLAANVLGITEGERNGIAGLEKQYNDLLTGTNGAETYEIAATGQRIPSAASTLKEMTPGQDIQTTIDRELQWYSDQRLADVVKSSGADYGLAITMDIRTCEIVQMSQAPTYNPDTRENVKSETLVNRALSNVYEPGSVMKLVTMAALADMGKIKADTKIKVPSSIRVDGFTIGDYWDHGSLNMTAGGVISLSSNLGTIVAAQQMSDSVFHSYLTKFGFGQLSGVDLPEETRGLVTPARDWTRSKHATTSFGQGISVNAVQIVRAVGAIANGGEMCTPSIAQSAVDADGKKTDLNDAKTTRVVSREAASEVTRMMEGVTADNGTAKGAHIEGYRVAGKTGTAWRVNPKTGRYVRGQNTVSFVGFAPADRPRFLTYVVIDNPPSNAGGGSLAGPVFKDIMSMALERFGVPPTGSKPPKVEHYW
ncbi:MAG: penicillin-binding protein 2 [Actinomycetales bacterium]|nr:penicillin-binding protein 2 [Actinomycetales bacterium]